MQQASRTVGKHGQQPDVAEGAGAAAVERAVHVAHEDLRALEEADLVAVADGGVPERRKGCGDERHQGGGGRLRSLHERQSAAAVFLLQQARSLAQHADALLLERQRVALPAQQRAQARPVQPRQPPRVQAARVALHARLQPPRQVVVLERRRARRARPKAEVEGVDDEEELGTGSENRHKNWEQALSRAWTVSAGRDSSTKCSLRSNAGLASTSLLSVQCVATAATDWASTRTSRADATTAAQDARTHASGQSSTAAMVQPAERASPHQEV